MFNLSFINTETKDPERFFEVLDILNNSINAEGFVLITQDLLDLITNKINYQQNEQTKRPLNIRYIDSIVKIGLYEKVANDKLIPLYNVNFDSDLVLSHVFNDKANIIFFYDMIISNNLEYLSELEISLIYYLLNLYNVNEENLKHYINIFSNHIKLIRENGTQDTIHEMLNICFNKGIKINLLINLIAILKDNKFSLEKKELEEYENRFIELNTDEEQLAVKIPSYKSVLDYSKNFIKYLNYTHAFKHFENKSFKFRKNCISIRNIDDFLYLDKSKRESMINEFLYSNSNDNQKKDRYYYICSPYRELDIVENKKEGKIINRSKSLPRKILDKSYKCFFDEIKNHTYEYYDLENKKPILEVHHFIHMSKAEEVYVKYQINIDSEFNMIPLCPCCHAAIHNANKLRKEELNFYIYNKLKDSLEEVLPNFDFNLFKNLEYF